MSLLGSCLHACRCDDVGDLLCGSDSVWKPHQPGRGYWHHQRSETLPTTARLAAPLRHHVSLLARGTHWTTHSFIHVFIYVLVQCFFCSAKFPPLTKMFSPKVQITCCFWTFRSHWAEQKHTHSLTAGVCDASRLTANAAHTKQMFPLLSLWTHVEERWVDESIKGAYRPLLTRHHQQRSSLSSPRCVKCYFSRCQAAFLKPIHCHSCWNRVKKHYRTRESC